MVICKNSCSDLGRDEISESVGGENFTEIRALGDYSMLLNSHAQICHVA